MKDHSLRFLLMCITTGFFKKGYSPSLPIRPTGIPLDTLKHIGNVFSTAPGGDFKIHGGINLLSGSFFFQGNGRGREREEKNNV